ncbi:hypothetical protein Ancab_008452 [Ancistrocladus abbreviatus]
MGVVGSQRHLCGVAFPTPLISEVSDHYSLSLPVSSLLTVKGSGSGAGDMGMEGGFSEACGIGGWGGKSSLIGEVIGFPIPPIPKVSDYYFLSPFLSPSMAICGAGDKEMRVRVSRSFWNGREGNTLKHVWLLLLIWKGLPFLVLLLQRLPIAPPISRHLLQPPHYDIPH